MQKPGPWQEQWMAIMPPDHTVTPSSILPANSASGKSGLLPANCAAIKLSIFCASVALCGGSSASHSRSYWAALGVGVKRPIGGPNMPGG
jgi:hypothetical protein